MFLQKKAENKEIFSIIMDIAGKSGGDSCDNKSCYF